MADHYTVAEAKRLIPEQQPQRQDSTLDQMMTVLALAIRAGCYDAADQIRKLMQGSGR